MKYLIIFTVLIASILAADDIKIDLTEDFNRMVEDRTIICNFFGNSRCATACSGVACTSSCVYDCGFFRTGTVLCSAANPTGCTA